MCAKKYTVIRKKDGLEKSSATFEETTTYINDVEVLAYRSSVTKYIIVGLKDEKGNSNYYICDNGKYTLYKEYKFNNVVLNILDMNDSLLPNSYVKSSFTYNEEEVDLYKDKADTYFKYLMILLGVIGVSLLSLGITLIVKAKNSNRRINK